MSKRFKLSYKMIQNFAVFWFIVSTGSLYFQILRAPFTSMVSLILSLIMLFNYKRVTKTNIKRTVLLCIIVFLNIIFNLNNGINFNGIIILAINILFLLVLQSNMTFIEFKKKYVSIMIVLAILSLFCFLYVNILKLGNLPLQGVQYREGTAGYILAPYHTVGWLNVGVFDRNAGIYGEPGSYQMFLNFALLFLLTDNNNLNLNKKKNILYIVVLVLTVLTTQSTTGYLCLLVVMLCALFLKGKVNSTKIKFLCLFGLIILLVIENQTQIIEYKLSGGSSYGTRYNDTFTGFEIAFQNFWTGKGLFSTTTYKYLKSFDIVHISNGFASFMIGVGVPLTLLWISYMFCRFNKAFKNGFVVVALIFVFYMLCVNSQGAFMNIIFLSFLFEWKKEDTLFSDPVV